MSSTSPFPHDKTDPCLALDTPEKISMAVTEIQALGAEIRTLLSQSTTQSVGVVVVLLALGATIGSHLAPSLVYVALPFIVGASLVSTFRDLSDVAALAELRDRLSARVNVAVGTQIFARRLVSDERRGSKGAAASTGMSAVLLLIVLAAGENQAMSDGRWWRITLQSLITIVVVAAAAIAFAESAQLRWRINDGLDREFGDGQRPATAPLRSDPWHKRLHQGLFGRGHES